MNNIADETKPVIEQVRSWFGNPPPHGIGGKLAIALADEYEALRVEMQSLRYHAELWCWLMSDGGRCASLIETQYRDWDGESDEDWKEFVEAEITFMRVREKRDRARLADSQSPMDPI